MQHEDIPEKIVQLSADFQSQTGRLLCLIQALILLAKIDNRQYSNEQTVNLTEIIRQILRGFQNIIDMKAISLQTNFMSEPYLIMKKELAEVLFLDLIKNAVRHNIPNGKIIIKLTGDYFYIQNTGNQLIGNPDKLFTRFAKTQPNGESLGIGLSIVQKICDLYGFKISYVYDELHPIKLSF